MARNHYVEPLTVEQAAEGMNVALTNASNLLDDAEVLFNVERFPRACSLAILSIEETGKVSILRGLLLCQDAKKLKDGWEDYRRHTAKNVMWILPELALKGANKIEDFGSLYSEKGHRSGLDALKQAGFYSDISKKGEWKRPETIVSREVCAQIIAIAKVLLRTDKAFTTIEQLNIWVKHMKPVWPGPMREMKAALVLCYEEAAALGILSVEDADNMKKFVSAEGLNHSNNGANERV